MLSRLDVGEAAPSLGSTATGHENNTTLEENKWRNIAGDFILCRVQPVAVCSALQVQFTTIRECTTKLFKDCAKIAQSLQTESKVRTQDAVRTECQIARKSRHFCNIVHKGNR